MYNLNRYEKYDIFNEIKKWEADYGVSLNDSMKKICLIDFSNCKKLLNFLYIFSTKPFLTYCKINCTGIVEPKGIRLSRKKRRETMKLELKF